MNKNGTIKFTSLIILYLMVRSLTLKNFNKFLYVPTQKFVVSFWMPSKFSRFVNCCSDWIHFTLDMTCLSRAHFKFLQFFATFFFRHLEFFHALLAFKPVSTITS